MVISMTGYGRAEAENEHMKVLVEIKTVNHRFCEYTYSNAAPADVSRGKSEEERRMNISEVDEWKFSSQLKVKISLLKN